MTVDHIYDLLDRAEGMLEMVRDAIEWGDYDRALSLLRDAGASLSSVLDGDGEEEA